MIPPQRQSHPPLPNDTPLVSVIMFCRNRVSSIERAVESLLNQTYPHWELVVQDGASTDGTREAIASYHDPRIKMVSEPDDGPFEAMWRALRRCQGEIIGSCLSDEALLPQALAEGVNYFLCFPEAMALSRDLYYSTLDGVHRKRVNCMDFNYHDYLGQESLLCFVTVLFRRSALDEIGLTTRSWRTNCADFELICRIGERYRFDYYPGPSALFAQGHPGQLSTTPEIGFFCTLGHLSFIHDFYAESPQRHLLGPLALQKAYQTVKKLYQSKGSLDLEQKLDDFFQQFPVAPVNFSLAIVKQAIAIGKLDLASGLLKKIPTDSPEYWEGQELTAEIFERFSVPEFASGIWARLMELKIPRASDRYLTSQLHHPAINSVKIFANQKKWAAQFHRSSPSASFRPPRPAGKPIRLGLHATDWKTLELQHQVLPLLAHFAPADFQTQVYLSPEESTLFPPEVQIRRLSDLSPSTFLEEVRRDQPDILIELSGLSNHHPFSALAERCAPIQMTYLGHMATTGLRTIDYQIVDDILCPPAQEKLQTEKMICLPDGYTCFDYVQGNQPGRPIPRRLDSSLTFGSFAHNSRINRLTLDHWGKILKIVPHSRLLLCNPDLNFDDAKNFIRCYFAPLDLPSESLLLLPRLPENIPLSALAQMDIYLDTFPHSDSVGIGRALAAGLPVVTLFGQTLAGRLGASLLRQAGHFEWVTTDLEQYVALAVTLSQRHQERMEWRETLPQQLYTNGLTNPGHFAKKLQLALQTILHPAP